MKNKYKKELLKNYKIKRWLSDRYHLYTKYVFERNLCVLKEWKLFRIYPNWLEDNSKPIMTSKTHTYKELFKFAKKHRKYNSSTIENIIFITLAWLNLILANLNLLLNSVILSGFIKRINTVIILVSCAKLFVLHHNQKIEKLEIKELEIEMEELKNE